jgi:hypothetical protein
VTLSAAHSDGQVDRLVSVLDELGLAEAGLATGGGPDPTREGGDLHHGGAVVAP